MSSILTLSKNHFLIPIFGSKKLIPNSAFKIPPPPPIYRNNMAAAPGIPADGALAPIHPELTYQDFFEAFSGYMFNGRVEGFYGYRAEVHDPMFAEIKATDHDFDQIINVHRKYVTHFFKTNPEGAQHALQTYLDFVLGGIYNRGLRENWDTHGSESVLPFIRSYVEHGASVLRLREFIQNYDNEFVEDEDPEILQQLKSAILSEIANELRKKAFNRRKHALYGWQMVRSGGRHRSIRKRKASKKTRRNHRVNHRK